MRTPNRKAPKGDPDCYPTHPDTTHDFLKRFQKDYIIDGLIWEPACGRGDMAEVLKTDTDGGVFASDLYDYGYGETGFDFCFPLNPRHREVVDKGVDWIITNPPFNQWEQFVTDALDFARMGVAMFGQLNCLEGVSRYNNIYSIRPPTAVYVHVRRQEWLSVRKKEEGEESAKQIAFAWYFWDIGSPGKEPLLRWIP